MQNINNSLNQPKSIFQIIKEAFFLYINNFINLSKPMVFPIMAHLLGIPYIFIISYYYPPLFPIEQREEMVFIIVITTILLTIPGFFLFLKGFWAYLIAMISLNRFAKGLIEKDLAVSMKACTEYVLARKKQFINILLFMMLIWIIGIVISFLPVILGFILPFWLVFLMILGLSILSTICIIIASIYFSLCFQVFAFEELTTIDIFKRSYQLVKDNFWRTLFLTIILMVITTMIMPFLIHTILQLVGIIGLISLALKGFSTDLINQLQNSSVLYPDYIVTSVSQMKQFMPNPAKMISETIVTFSIDAIVTAGMLPFGTICYTLLYHDIILKKAISGIK